MSKDIQFQLGPEPGWQILTIYGLWWNEERQAPGRTRFNVTRSLDDRSRWIIEPAYHAFGESQGDRSVDEAAKFLEESMECNGGYSSLKDLKFWLHDALRGKGIK